MPHDLLVEVGVEEMPATFVDLALNEWPRRIADALAEVRLSCAGARGFAAPRRFAVVATGVTDRQEDRRERMVGPPAGVAFDKNGTPTQAAVGFAQRNGVEVTQLQRTTVEGKKGEYVVCVREEKGREARELLPDVVTGVLRTMPWPKSMRWGVQMQAFPRPIRWLACVYGGQVLPFSFAGVAAGGVSFGHRFLAPQAIELNGTAQQYCDALRAAFVVVDAERRKAMVQAELARSETEVGLVVRADPRLLAEVSNLVEYPVGVCGEFGAEYLQLPDEVVVSAMRAHQRYFAMEDSSGRLANRFVTITGTVTRDVDTVRAGNERVLAARLADAEFFYREDQKLGLDVLGRRLEGLLFQERLGSVADKVERVAAASRELALEVGVDAEVSERAARLCKSDLCSHVVGEFPDLQGVVGKYYALAAGESQGVAEGIAQHYRPQSAADELPVSDIATIVGIADRVDTIVGCFAAGLAPTGSADPYALRRAALAVLRLLTERRDRSSGAKRPWRVSLGDLVARALCHLQGVVEAEETTEETVMEFFRTRLRGLLVETHGLPADSVEAALVAGFDRPGDAKARAEAVVELRKQGDFDSLAAAMKRVGNMLKGLSSSGQPNEKLFSAPDERKLWTQFVAARERVGPCLENGEYLQALRILGALKQPVDSFFDTVLVMDPDQAVRANRLALLDTIHQTFAQIADFRQLAV